MPRTYDSDFVATLLSFFEEQLAAERESIERLTDLMREYPMLPAIEVLDAFEDMGGRDE